MRLRRLLLFFFFASVVLAACGGTTDDGANPSGAASSVPRQASENATALPERSGVRSIAVSEGYCGGAAGTCYGQRTFTITFATATLERFTCVETDGGTAKSTRKLSDLEVQRVRDAIAGIRISSDGFEALDGRMFALSITSASGVESYSPEAACGHDRFKKIVGGWNQLWSAVSSL
jgi:hypothetical protein